MNEELQSKMVEILTSVQNATKSAGDFAMEQLPDIAQSYLIYGRVIASMSLFISMIVFAASVLIVYRIYVYVKKEGDEADPMIFVFVGTLTACASIASFFVTWNKLSEAALVWLAPKVWLLKELASFIK